MDWIKRMNDAMEFIEANLDGEISCDRVAQIACCSTYHLQRMFPYITGALRYLNIYDADG